MASELMRLGYYKAEDGSFQPVSLKAADIKASNGVTVEQHIANDGIHLSTEQIEKITNAIQSSAIGETVAPLVDGKVPAEYIAVNLANGVENVADYTALIALSAEEAPADKVVLVKDATDDETVQSGWAMYIRIGVAGTADDWFKLVEGESIDIDFSDFLKSSDLSDAVNSDDSKKAASSKAVKTAYDRANEALTAANLLDVAFCESEADMAGKNLRDGAIVFMRT